MSQFSVHAKAPDSALGILTEYVLGNVRKQRAPTEGHLLSGRGMESRVQEGTPAPYAAKGSYAEGSKEFIRKAVGFYVQGRRLGGRRLGAGTWVLVRKWRGPKCKGNVSLEEYVFKDC